MIKQLLIQNAGGESPCTFLLDFDKLSDAKSNFQYAIDNFGNKNYFAIFKESGNGFMDIILESPKNLELSLGFTTIEYNENDFFIFTQSPRNAQLFVIMFGFSSPNGFVSAGQNPTQSYLEVRGFRVEK